MALSCAGWSGWESNEYINTLQRLVRWLPHILQQIVDKLHKIPDVKAKSPLICEQWGVKYCMVHGIDDTDPTGVSIVLLPNREGPTQVLELGGKYTAQPHTEPLVESLQTIALACATRI